VVRTFSVQDLVRYFSSVSTIETIFQLPVLSLGQDYQTKIIPMMQKADNKLTPENISALAHVVLFSGMDHSSSIGALSQMVGDLLRGLGFVLAKYSDAEWLHKAAIFAHAIGKNSDTPLGNKEQDLRLAFLNGVVWSLGEFIYQHRMNKMSTMWTRANKIGLDCPARILSSGLDAEKRHLSGLQKRQHTIFQRS